MNIFLYLSGSKVYRKILSRRQCVVNDLKRPSINSFRIMVIEKLASCCQYGTTSLKLSTRVILFRWSSFNEINWQSASFAVELMSTFCNVNLLIPYANVINMLGRIISRYRV